VYVQLAVEWADPSGAVHAAGEFVDIDAVTLAELEEQGVVESAGEEIERPEWAGPGESDDSKTPDWAGPGESDDDEESDGDADDDDK
jgi:hypothetical protein